MLWQIPIQIFTVLIIRLINIVYTIVYCEASNVHFKDVSAKFRGASIFKWFTI